MWSCLIEHFAFTRLLPAQYVQKLAQIFQEDKTKIEKHFRKIFVYIFIEVSCARGYLYIQFFDKESGLIH